MHLIPYILNCFFIRKPTINTIIVYCTRLGKEKYISRTNFRLQAGSKNAKDNIDLYLTFWDQGSCCHGRGALPQKAIRFLTVQKMKQSTWNWASQHKLVCRNRALYMFCWGMNLKCLTKAMRISCHSDLWMSMWRDACAIALEAGTPAGCVSPKQKKKGLPRYKSPWYKSFSFWTADYL